jgi:hypothetical protein
MTGRVKWDVERKMSNAAFEVHKRTLILAELILAQKRTPKGKVYSLHAPEVECIAKGKAHKPYEFSVKISLAVTHMEGFVVGIQACPVKRSQGPAESSEGFRRIDLIISKSQSRPSLLRSEGTPGIYSLDTGTRNVLFTHTKTELPPKGSVPLALRGSHDL